MTSLDESASRARLRATTVGVVTADAADKRAVLAAIGRELHFPDYYAPNLDALEECLRDLSWLPTGPIELVWDDAALRDADPKAHRSVLSVLRAAVGADVEHPLRIVLVGGQERGVE